MVVSSEQELDATFELTLILVDNTVFVLQATQSINSRNLEASRLQVHFLQHVKLHVFGEDVF